MKRYFILVMAMTMVLAVNAQEKVKNVILMIPDGCSIATMSTARWYQWYMNPDQERLNIDPYFCGTVRTTCSNAPIGDSAPTTSCYMTGYNSRKGWVSTYPLADPDNDIYPMDPARAYQPLTTVLEASRMLQGKSTGLVFTCYVPHATPADCSAHCFDRSDLMTIANQQVHNGLDVVIGGGNDYLTPENEQYLKDKGYSIVRNNIPEMRACQNNKMWALYGEGDMDAEILRNPEEQPSIAEMTETAIKKLSTNKKGFFLMVEGSQVDYCAHANNIIGMITEFLAFDKACKVALDFAEKDGNTAVVILSDHGNSGLSIGRRNEDYATRTKDQLFGALAGYKTNPANMAKILRDNPESEIEPLMKEWLGLELKDRELDMLKERREGSGLTDAITHLMTSRTGLAFTTGGHTGEDVIVAAYHPKSSSRPYGMLSNIEMNDYLCRISGFTHNDLEHLTAENFQPHTEVLKGHKYEVIDGVLNAEVDGRKVCYYPNTNIVEVDGQKKELRSVIVYCKKNETFYIPRKI